MQVYRTPSERFWAKVDKSGECWLWMGCRDRDGYGRFKPTTTTPESGAHRFAYEELVAPIPHPLQIDHLCRNRACVQPDHMEVVTARENTLRGNTVAARRAAQVVCVNGHPFTAENTYRYPSNYRNGGRRCRTCQRSTWLRWKARQVA